MPDLAAIQQRVDRLCARFVDRDRRMANVRNVREGKMAESFPSFFASDGEQPLVNNLIDVVARDLSEAIAPLPALNCTSGVITNDRARRFANRRQRIGASYWAGSNLALQMFGAADNYLTTGFAAAIIEPCYESDSPKIRWLDSRGTYFDLDHDGDCRLLVRKWKCKASHLAALYPEYAGVILRRDVWQSPGTERELDVIRYVDDKQSVLYLPGVSKGFLLDAMPNRLGRCPAVVAVRPSPDGEIRGQFDDVLGIQAARAYMLRLAVEAAEKQVQAPIAVPDDVTEIAMGSDAILRSAEPQNIRRVALTVGDSTFRETATLNQELLTGMRFPEGRIGNSNASVITGRGVEALMGGYDSQIKTAQIMFAGALQKATGLAFEMDEKLWGAKAKTITGTVEGTPFSEDYTPAKDIKGDYTCDVSYGFLAGMDPNRALVFLLQLRGDRLIDRATVQKQMPFDVDVTALQQNIEVEQLRDAQLQGVLAYVQAMGPMAAQGQDPTKILKVISAAIKGRQQGKPLEEVLAEQFEAMAAEEAAKQQAMMEQLAAGAQGAAPGGGSDGNTLPGVGPGGLLTDVASGQAGMAPGGRPSVQTLMAGLASDGTPNLRAGVARQIAA